MSGSRWFTLLVVAETVAIAAVKWPNQLFLGAYAFGDQGANLAADRLIVEGWRPGIDFNYLYGFLSLLVGRVTFALFGCTPLVYALATTSLVVAMTALLARTAVALAVPAAGRVLLVAALPFAVAQLPPLNFAHATEALLLAAAIYLQARGKDSWALAATTAAVLAKPALGYVYGLLLLVRLAAFPPGEGPWLRRFARDLLPAAITGVVLLAVLVVCFGPTPVAGSLLPLKARAVYEFEQFGFFTGKGRGFWRPEGANFRYYLGSAAGFWIAATLLLVAYTVVAVVRRRRHANSPAAGVAVSCAMLHISFVLFAFGNGYSWTYYACLLITGVVAATGVGVWAQRFAWALAALAVVGCYTEVRGVIGMWQTRQPHAACGGLYATAPGAADWDRLHHLAGQRRVFVLNYLGGAFVLDAEIDSTRAWCLYWWIATEQEKADVVARIRAADVIAVPKHIDMLAEPTHPLNAPTLVPELAAFPHVVEWPTFTLRFRTAPSHEQSP